jgi:hypothetical protein
MAGIRYEGAEHRSANILVRPNCEFPTLLGTFNAIRYPDTGVSDEQISFAILELVSNSLRAHRERGKDESVAVRVWIEGALMMVSVSDRGGGFDPSRLPYGLDEPVESLDLMAPGFIAYRERYDNARFGMGLVAVRKIFPVFSLKFVDPSGADLPWPSPGIEGTIIVLGLPLKA